MIGMIFRTLFLCGVLALLSLGTLKHFLRKTSSSCAMTFMYEAPKFIPISVFAEHRRRFPNYNLYLYGEGAYAEWLRQGNYQGIPVLFLPGSSGSYKQVRSLASVSLTRAQIRNSSFYFNYFTIDFNEEVSAMYGGSLSMETEYAAIAVKTILSLYDDQESKPTSVVIVGHSMGGLVAKAMLQLPKPKMDPSLISVIFFQATPLLKPVLEVDFEIVNFYHTVNSFWAANRNGSLKHINLISVGGGDNDIMVRSDLTQFPLESASEHDISILSSSIPGVWSTTDHLSIVWCNQLVLTTVRTLFKLVDPTTEQILQDTKTRTNIAKAFFIHGQGRAERLSLSKSWGSPVDDKLWTTIGPRRRRYSGASKASALVLPVERGRAVVIYAKHMDLEPWVFGCRLEAGVNGDLPFFCKATERILCGSPFHYLPSETGLTKVFRCEEACCSRETHLIIKLPSNQTDVEVVTETYDSAQRRWNISLASPQILYDNVTIQIPKGSLYASVGFPHLFDSWQAFRAVITASGSKCSGAAQFVVPWSREETYSVIKPGETVHSIKLFSSDVTRTQRSNGSFPELRLYFYSECTVSVTMQFSLLDTLQQVIRFDVLQMPGLLAASLLHIFSKQLSSLGERGVCKSAWHHFSLGAIANDIVFAHLVASVVRWIYEFLPVDIKMILPSPSFEVPTSQKGFLSVASHLLLYCASAGIVLLVYGVIFMGMVPPSKIIASLLDRFQLFTGTGRSFAIPLLLVKGAVCLLLAYVAYSTCGALALFPLQALFALELFRSHLGVFRLGHPIKRQLATSQCRLSVTVYLLWGTVLQMNAPTLVFWIQNLKENDYKSIEQLNPDPSFISAVLLLISMWGSLKVDDVHRRKELFRWLSHVQRFFVFLLLVFGLEHFYLVTWILATDVLLLSLWVHVLGRWWGQRSLPRIASKKYIARQNITTGSASASHQHRNTAGKKSPTTTAGSTNDSTKKKI